jgi:hypothetical protein
MATRFVGDSNAPNRIKGSTDGAAVPAGYVGEVKFASQTFAGLGANPSSFGAALTLTPGIWLCILHGSFQAQVPTDMLVRLADNSNTVITADSYGMSTVVDCGNSAGGSEVSSMFVMRVSADTTYKVNVNGIVQPAGATNIAYFEAIRIA